ncbi:MAG: hypothetical protein ABIP10_24050, partial [Ferruginibacter sp.]
KPQLTIVRTIAFLTIHGLPRDNGTMVVHGDLLCGTSSNWQTGLEFQNDKEGGEIYCKYVVNYHGLKNLIWVWTEPNTNYKY